MIIHSFRPGMIVETQFLMPGTRVSRTCLKLCVVMSVHVKGLLVHPFMARGSSSEPNAVYTRMGRVACDLRNIIESPASFAIAQAMRAGKADFAKAHLNAEDFGDVRKKSLDCAYNGLMKCERLKATSTAFGGRRSA